MYEITTTTLWFVIALLAVFCFVVLLDCLKARKELADMKRTLNHNHVKEPNT